jgi:hypothetical protein
MADTPTLPLPLDSREQPILDSLMRIRDELTLLKQDRTTYVKSSDVVTLYERVVDQVKLLNEIRIDKPQENNQGKCSQSKCSISLLIAIYTVDRVLDGCFQLLSLFFMTIGRNNEAPAAYALTSTIKRLLDHLTEVDLYSEKDLTHCSHTLAKLREIVKTAEPHYSPKLVTLLSNRIEVCQASLTNLQNRLDRLGGDLPTIHEKLISILRSISLANTKAKVRSWKTVACYARGKLLTGLIVFFYRGPKAAGAGQGSRRATGGWEVRLSQWRSASWQRGSLRAPEQVLSLVRDCSRTASDP